MQTSRLSQLTSIEEMYCQQYRKAINRESFRRGILGTRSFFVQDRKSRAKSREEISSQLLLRVFALYGSLISYEIFLNNNDSTPDKKRR